MVVLSSQGVVVLVGKKARIPLHSLGGVASKSGRKQSQNEHCARNVLGLVFYDNSLSSLCVLGARPLMVFVRSDIMLKNHGARRRLCRQGKARSRGSGRWVCR